MIAKRTVWKHFTLLSFVAALPSLGVFRPIEAEDIPACSSVDVIRGRQHPVERSLPFDFIGLSGCMGLKIGGWYAAQGLVRPQRCRPYPWSIYPPAASAAIFGDVGGDLFCSRIRNLTGFYASAYESSSSKNCYVRGRLLGYTVVARSDPRKATLMAPLGIYRRTGVSIGVANVVGRDINITPSIQCGVLGALTASTEGDPAVSGFAVSSANFIDDQTIATIPPFDIVLKVTGNLFRSYVQGSVTARPGEEVVDGDVTLRVNESSLSLKLAVEWMYSDRAVSSRTLVLPWVQDGYEVELLP